MGTSGGFSSLSFLEFLDLCNFRAFMEFLELCCISIYYYYYYYLFSYLICQNKTAPHLHILLHPTILHQYQNLKLLEIVPTIDIKHTTHKHPPCSRMWKQVELTDVNARKIMTSLGDVNTMRYELYEIADLS